MHILCLPFRYPYIFFATLFASKMHILCLPFQGTYVRTMALPLCTYFLTFGCASSYPFFTPLGYWVRKQRRSPPTLPVPVPVPVPPKGVKKGVKKGVQVNKGVQVRLTFGFLSPLVMESVAKKGTDTSTQGNQR